MVTNIDHMIIEILNLCVSAVNLIFYDLFNGRADYHKFLHLKRFIIIPWDFDLHNPDFEILKFIVIGNILI